MNCRPFFNEQCRFLFEYLVEVPTQIFVVNVKEKEKKKQNPFPIHNNLHIEFFIEKIKHNMSNVLVDPT